MTGTKANQFNQKRNDTQIDTIEKMYGKELGNYLKEKGYNSLSQLLKNG